MGNCCAAEKETRRTVNRQSSLANLDDSRHTMMKKAASTRGGMMTEGSFYRPRSERILTGIPKADDPDSDIDDDVGVTDLPVFRNSGKLFIEDMRKSSKAGKEKTADTAASKEKELRSIEEESEAKE